MSTHGLGSSEGPGYRVGFSTDRSTLDETVMKPVCHDVGHSFANGIEPPSIQLRCFEAADSNPWRNLFQQSFGHIGHIATSWRTELCPIRCTCSTCTHACGKVDYLCHHIKPVICYPQESSLKFPTSFLADSSKSMATN